jgi:hypothetical protein
MEPTEIIDGMDGALWVKLGEASFIPVSKSHGEWCGPLEPPHDQEAG